MRWIWMYSVMIRDGSLLSKVKWMPSYWLQHINLWCDCQWYAAIDLKQAICRVSIMWDPYFFLISCPDLLMRPTHVANPSLSWLLLMCVLPPSAPTEISCGWQSSCQSHEQVGFVHSGRSTFLLWLCISLSAKSLGTFVPADISPSAISNLLPGLDLGCKNVRIFTDYQ